MCIAIFTKERQDILKFHRLKQEDDQKRADYARTLKSLAELRYLASLLTCKIYALTCLCFHKSTFLVVSSKMPRSDAVTTQRQQVMLSSM